MDEILNSNYQSICKNQNNIGLLNYLRKECKQKNFTVDELLKLAENELIYSKKKLKVIQSNITQRIRDAVDPNKAINEYIIPNEVIDGQSVYWIYTKQNLEDNIRRNIKFDEEVNILADSIYQTEIDLKYIDYKEKQFKKNQYTNFCLYKKYAHSSEGIIDTRRHSQEGLQLPKIQISFQIPHQTQNFLSNSNNKSCQVCNEDHNISSNILLVCSVNLKIILVMRLQSSRAMLWSNI